MERGESGYGCESGRRRFGSPLLCAIARRAQLWVIAAPSMNFLGCCAGSLRPLFLNTSHKPKCQLFLVACYSRRPCASSFAESPPNVRCQNGSIGIALTKLPLSPPHSLHHSARRQQLPVTMASSADLFAPPSSDELASRVTAEVRGDGDWAVQPAESRDVATQSCRADEASLAQAGLAAMRAAKMARPIGEDAGHVGIGWSSSSDDGASSFPPLPPPPTYPEFSDMNELWRSASCRSPPVHIARLTFTPPPLHTLTLAHLGTHFVNQTSVAKWVRGVSLDLPDCHRRRHLCRQPYGSDGRAGAAKGKHWPGCRVCKRAEVLPRRQPHIRVRCNVATTP
jgi:hypothetical protein